MVIFLTASRQDEPFDFEYIYQKYKNMVWKQIKNSTITDISLQEEIMQDVFVKLYLTLGRFQSERAIMRWIQLVTKSTIIDSGMKAATYEKHIRIILDDEEIFDSCINILENAPLDELVKKEAAGELVNELCKLKPIHFEVIILYYYSEFSVKEIAERLHISENTIYSRLSRARSILYENISDSLKEYFLNGGVSYER